MIVALAKLVSSLFCQKWMRLDLLIQCSVMLGLTLSITFNTQAEEIIEQNNLQEHSESQALNDDLENLGRIYKGDSSQNLQELWLLGRYHGQYYWTRDSKEDENDFESRRIRFGTQAKLFQKLTLHAQAISGSDFNPSYNGFSELWAQWAFSPAFKLSAGQQKHRFSHDRNVSSRYINYLERSLLTNMFAADYTPALTIQGDIKKTSYYTGIFSNATGKNIGESFSQLDSGHSFIAAAYQNISDYLGTDSAYLHASFLNSDANQNATLLNYFNNGLSSALILTDQSFSLVNEITAGTGGKDGDAYALNVQPGIFLTDTLQAVGRYQLGLSDGAHGLHPQRRYEKAAGLEQGDLYQAVYLGLNYYLLKHCLKLMQGVEYSEMQGDHVWTASAMIRLYFGPHSNGAFL